MFYVAVVHGSWDYNFNAENAGILEGQDTPVLRQQHLVAVVALGLHSEFQVPPAGQPHKFLHHLVRVASTKHMLPDMPEAGLPAPHHKVLSGVSCKFLQVEGLTGGHQGRSVYCCRELLPGDDEAEDHFTLKNR